MKTLFAFILHFLLATGSLLLASTYIPGIQIDSFNTALIASLILFLFRYTLKPILFILTLPITFITLGLFGFVLNALLFYFAGSFIQGFEVVSFGAALLGSLLVSFVRFIGDKIIDFFIQD